MSRPASTSAISRRVELVPMSTTATRTYTSLADRAYLDPMTAAPTIGHSVKPRLRGVLHQWAFFVSLIAGAVLVIVAPAGRATLATAVYAFTVAGLFGVSAVYHRVNWVSAKARAWMR